MTFEASLGQMLSAAAIQQHEFNTDRCEEPPHARPTMIQAQRGHPSVGPSLFTPTTVMYMRRSCGGRMDMSIASNCTCVAFSPDTKSCGTRSFCFGATSHGTFQVTPTCGGPSTISSMLAFVFAPLPRKIPSTVMSNTAPVRS